MDMKYTHTFYLFVSMRPLLLRFIWRNFLLYARLPTLSALPDLDPLSTHRQQIHEAHMTLDSGDSGTQSAS